MSSFTNPPPGNPRKFQFENDFGDGEDAAPAPAAEEFVIPELPPEPVAPPEPVFSGTQLIDARDAGFRDGYAQAMDEAQRNDNSVISGLVAQITAHLELLATGEEQRLMAAHETALQTTIGIIKKIWPAVVQQTGLPMIEATLRQSMDSNPDETRIVVRVHDRLLDALIERLPQLQMQQGFAGKVIALADSSVQPGDCKVEWADGGMERLSRGLSVQLDHALERIMANLPQISQNETR